MGLRPRARFVGFSIAGSDLIEMPTEVIPATERVLSRAGLSIGGIDACEVNAAFAPVPLAWQRAAGADLNKLNHRGGAIAFGSTGTRKLGTLLHHLEDTDGRYGLEPVCEIQDMANATIIERISL